MALGQQLTSSLTTRSLSVLSCINERINLIAFQTKTLHNVPHSSEGDPAGPTGLAPVQARQHRGPGATAAQAAEKRHNGGALLAGGRFQEGL